MRATVECNTHEELKNGGKGLAVSYSFASTPFGEVVMASTDKGICCLEFVDCRSGSPREDAVSALSDRFPYARLSRGCDEIHRNVLDAFMMDRGDLEYETRLHLVGTEFQRKVWVSLLKIPRGATATYGEIPPKIGNPYACRAVGSAVGHNPVSLIVPCHRVVPSSGDIGNYRWGRAIKKSILEWESTDD